MPIKKETFNHERQKFEASRNQTKVFNAVVRRSLTFSDLLKETRFPKPTLWHHLKSLLSCGFIFKDTVKPNEKSRYEVGTDVYRVAPSKQRDFFEEGILSSLSFLTEMIYYNGENGKRISKEINRFVDSVTSIIIEDSKEMDKDLDE